MNDVVINKPNFEDRTLTCADCGEDFIFTVGEQVFFWDKGLSEPKRCKQCRMIRKRSIVNIEEERNVKSSSTKSS
jgi:hypothetical protein